MNICPEYKDGRCSGVTGTGACDRCCHGCESPCWAQCEDAKRGEG